MEENNQAVLDSVNQELVKEIVEQAKVKPYTFRKLKASDIPYATNLLKKMGINKLSNLLKSETVVSLLKGSTDKESLDIIAGGAIFFEIAQIILESVGDCEELYKLLSVTSNLSLEQVKDLDLDVFFEMVVDFVKKEEFMGFFKAVSKYLA